MASPLREWFCFKEGRDNFKPHNIRDGNLSFCHQQLLSDEIIGSIERRFAANEPVKMLIYGDWGVGKTHAVYHIRWWLETKRDIYPAYPVVIEIGDINKTTRFDALVRPFLEALGLDFLVQLVHDYLKQRPNVVHALAGAGVGSSVAEAFSKLLLASPGSTPPPMVLQAFEYLKGRKLAPAAASMGFGQSLSGSNDFFHVLLGIGEMYRVVHGARIIYMADEAAKLEAVDTDDAIRAHWENVNKLIFDDTNGTFGFVYTISGRARRSLPQALLSSQLQNRLGDNIFEMKNLQPADVGLFLRNLVDEFVDRKKVEALVGTGGINAVEYSWEAYPFTGDAKSEFIDYFSRSQENSKPRDISNKLNDAGFVASKSAKRLIDVDCLRKAQM